MKEYFQFVGNDDGTQQSTPSLYLFSDAHRCMFNCPEGVQRFSSESRMRLTKINAYCWTTVRPHTVMGLPGLSFTINDAGIESMSLYGPPAIGSFWNTIYTTFYQYRKMSTSISTFSPSGSTSIGTVSPAVRHPPIQLGSMSIHPMTLQCGSCQYLCSVANEMKFSRELAKKCGVRPGPKYGILKAGKPVESDVEAGKMVSPESVLLPGEEGRCALVAECQSEAQVRELAATVSNLGFDLGRIHTVFHLSSNEVVANGAFLRSLQSTFPTARHEFGPRNNPLLQKLLSDPKMWNVSVPRLHDVFTPGTALPGAYLHRLHLALCDPSVFPSIPPQAAAGAAGDSSPVPWPYARRFALRDDSSDELDTFLVPNSATAPQYFIGDFAQKWLSSAPTPTSTASPMKGLEDFRGKVVFFGTGSAVPSKYRNVSSFLLAPPSSTAQPSPSNDDPSSLEGVVLCDVGEGTVSQMHIVFGCPSIVEDLILSIEVIFISHMHADHNLGYFSLVSTRNRLISWGRKAARLTVVCPSEFKQMMDEFALLSPEFSHSADTEFVVWAPVRYQKNQYRQRHNDVVNPVVATSTSKNWGSITFPVDHPAEAVAAVFTHNTTGLKWCYSGDTRPCNEVVHFANGVDLLIHEATFADGMEEEARTKRHCTFREAMDVAVRCNAKALMLTHFSQRFPKGPGEGIGAAIKGLTIPCAFAFDAMVLDMDPDVLKAGAAKLPVFAALLEEYEGNDGLSTRIRGNMVAATDRKRGREDAETEEEEKKL